MPILTTGNTIKQGPMWCDDADEITQTALDISGWDWDTQWPIQYGLEHCGLGNALLALGTPLPRYKKQAVQVQADYIRYLFHEAREIAQRHGFTVADVGQWLTMDNRKVSCLAQCKIWRDVERAADTAGISNLARGMAFIFDQNKELIHRTVMGTKHIVTGQRLLEDETRSLQTINLLKAYLKGQLDNV